MDGPHVRGRCWPRWLLPRVRSPATRHLRGVGARERPAACRSGVTCKSSGPRRRPFDLPGLPTFDRLTGAWQFHEPCHRALLDGVARQLNANGQLPIAALRTAEPIEPRVSANIFGARTAAKQSVRLGVTPATGMPSTIRSGVTSSIVIPCVQRGFRTPMPGALTRTALLISTRSGDSLLGGS